MLKSSRIKLLDGNCLHQVKTPGGIDVKSLKDVKAKLLTNTAARQAYDVQAPEFELARELIAARMRAVLFTQRMNLFFGRVDAKELAQRLMTRDREQDDRRLCLECRHFKPHRLECNNFEWAGFTQPKLGSNWVSQLQRCLGFEEVEIWASGGAISTVSKCK